MKRIVVSNENQAFALLEKALAHELGDRPFVLEFDNWPVLSIKLKGEGYDSTITSDLAQALVEIQTAVNRAYARVVHNASDARRLTDGERKDIQFKAKVKKGSSLVEVNLGDFAEKLATEAVGKMTPEMIVVTVLGIAITGAGLLAYKAFLKHRSADKQIEQDMRSRMILSQEETRRLEIFGEAMNRSQAVRYANSDFDTARTDIVRAAADADTLSVNALEIDSATARTLGASRRTESIEVQLNGNYIISTVDLRRPDEIKLRVQSASDGREFVASFRDQSLDQNQIALLQAAEWSRNPVYLSINARVLRGEVTAATVISVTQQPIP